jgi:Secretion system C-terminal sorting domain/Beta-propeller repeat
MKKRYFLSTCIFAFFLTIQSSIAQTAPAWEWSRHAGGDGTEENPRIATDGQGNVYSTGTYFSDNIAIGSETLINAGTGGEYQTVDSYLAKYDSQGNILWVRHLGGALNDVISALTTDNEGNILIGGSSGSPFLIFDTVTLTNTTQETNHSFIAKYSSDGDVLWAKNTTGSQTDHISNLATDASGNIYAGGTFNDTVYFGNGITVDLVGGTEYYDAFFVKYNSDGVPQWAKSVGGDYYDSCIDLITDPQGNFYATGYFYSSQIAFGTSVLTNAASNNTCDIFIVKYNSAGTVLWAQKEGGTRNDLGISLLADNNGHVYLAGYYASLSITFGATTLTNTSDLPDIFLAKYNSTGGPALWTKTAIGQNFDSITKILYDTDGNIYTLGMFGGDGSGEPSITFPGLPTISSAGQSDILVTKYSPEGNAIWVKTAGSTERDGVTSAAIDNQNNMYVTGTFNSPSVTFDDQVIQQTGGQDIFIAKIPVAALATQSFETNAVNLYPNPAKNILNITGDVYVPFTITDVTGRTVAQGQTEANAIDVSRLPSGLYLININDTIVKFIKE